MAAKTFDEILKSNQNTEMVVFEPDEELDLVVATWTDTDGIYADDIEKAGGNPYHDEKGRFTFAPGGKNPMIRTAPPPKNTKIAYKVFVARDGKLYPPMVANPDGQATPVGVWLDASEGQKALNPDGTPVTNTLGRAKVKAGGKGTQGGSGTLAYRPGWHLGEVPEAKQFYTKDKVTGEKKQKKNFVWAECEIAADHDYQEEAMSYGYNKNGKFQHSLAGLPKIPTDGYYTYRTNPDPTTKPWYITGAMKVNRILTDKETNAILRSHGIEPMKRDGGELDLAALGFTETNFVKKSALFDEIIEVEKGNPYHDERGRFTSASGAAAGGAFVPAKTIEEAREYAKTKLGFSGTVDYSYSYIDQKEIRQVTGTLDIDTVNHINKTITDIQERYPETNGYVKNLFCTDRNVYAAVIHDGRDATASLVIGAKTYKDGIEAVNKKYAEDVELGYHPKGTDGSSILWHEYGHVYAGIGNEKACGDRLTPENKMGAIRMKVAESQWKSEAVDKIRSDKNLMRDYEMLGLDSSPAAISKSYAGNVSRYATANTGELFAEAFAAYNTGQRTRWTDALMEAAGADRRY